MATMASASVPHLRTCPAALLLALLATAPALHARTVYRCVLDGTVSLATAPEPGSTCVPHQLDDADPRAPNLWGSLGDFSGTLYAREQDGRTVYSTRALPGSTPVLGFTASTPAGSPAHPGLGTVGAARLDRFDREFRAAARSTGIDDAWLRAIAHAESYFDPAAVSDKGAMGVMQLMPDVVSDYGVENPFSAAESIAAGARHLRFLHAHFDGDLDLVAAGYNAGIGAVTEHGGIPPYPETQLYVAKVHALHARYRAALGQPVPAASERPAIAPLQE
jgi:hypothetical protein